MGVLEGRRGRRGSRLRRTAVLLSLLLAMLVYLAIAERERSSEARTTIAQLEKQIGGQQLSNVIRFPYY